jgi:hypothetical protein
MVDGVNTIKLILAMQLTKSIGNLIRKTGILI